MKAYGLRAWCEPSRFERLLDIYHRTVERLRINGDDIDPEWPMALVQRAMVVLSEENRVRAIETWKPE